MPKLITLHELFVDMLRDIYYAKKKIPKAPPKMAKQSPLAAAFEAHREETEGQVTPLEQVFQSIGENPRGQDMRLAPCRGRRRHPRAGCSYVG
jgi:ferritin-like metal-binding protein YciE